MLAAADKAALAPAVFAKGSVAVQGFPALERLLFEGGAPTGYALDLAVAITGNLVAMADGIETGWRDRSTGFGKLLATPGPTNPMFGDAKAICGFIATELATGMKALDELKLRRVVGRKGATAPMRGENWRSARSLANVRINLEAFAALFAAFSEEADLGDQDRARAKFVAGQFNAVIEKTRMLGPSMVNAASTEQGVLQLRGLTAGVEDLFEVMAGFLGDVLKLTMGFNSLDGD